MSRKIFRAIWAVTLAVFFVFLVIIMLQQYRWLSEIQNAVRLSDDSALRIAAAHASMGRLLMEIALPALLVILLALGVSFAAACRLSRKLVEPINNLELDDPVRYIGQSDYSEIEPLLQRLDRQHAQIERDKAELERSSQIRQEFTANVSHELKTPLHVISGYAELLESGMARPEDVQPFAGKIRAESQRMTKLVEDIIDLTELDSGVGLQWEETDLYRVAENAVGSLESAAAAAGVRLELEGESTPMRGVQQHLYSIVYNLCDNAIKYSSPGGSVNVRVENRSDSAVLTVGDTGIGIPENQQSRIFERFYRVDKSRSKAVGGTGLGLSIVKHAAMVHHASIAVESEQGVGSVFTITFPKT